MFSTRRPQVSVHVNGDAVITVAADQSSGGGARRPFGAVPVTGLTLVDFVMLPARARITLTWQALDSAALEEPGEGFLALMAI